jgi:hypothetical protein
MKTHNDLVRRLRRLEQLAGIPITPDGSLLQRIERLEHQAAVKANGMIEGEGLSKGDEQ